jgi:hypothetical protein
MKKILFIMLVGLISCSNSENNAKITENCNKIKNDEVFKEVITECYINQFMLPKLTDDIYNQIIDELSDLKPEQLQEIKESKDKRELIRLMQVSGEWNSKFNITPDTCFFANGFYNVIDSFDTIRVPKYTVDMFNELDSVVIEERDFVVYTSNDSVLIKSNYEREKELGQIEYNKLKAMGFIDFLKEFTKDRASQLALINKPLILINEYESGRETNFWDENKLNKEWELIKYDDFLFGRRKEPTECNFHGGWIIEEKKVIYATQGSGGCAYSYIFKKIGKKWYMCSINDRSM